MRNKEYDDIVSPLVNRVLKKRLDSRPARMYRRGLPSRATLHENMSQIREAARKSDKLSIEVFRTMASAIDEKDLYTRGHSERVTRFSVEIARIMGIHEDDVERIRIGALIHDIGKLTIDSEILNKPSGLTMAEYELMKSHTIKGYEMLKHIPHLEDVLPGTQSHHEHLDGSGYPYGLKGDQIPKIARIITVADCFDAMTTTRPYQNSAPVDQALGVLKSKSGTKFDESAVEALIDAVRSGRIAMRLQDTLQSERARQDS